MFDRLKAGLTAQRQALRSGQVVRVGPVSLMRSIYLEGLRNRVTSLERKLAQAGATAPAAESRDAKQRSVVFLHNSYYNFYYLARALRKRGWDAVSVSVEDPQGPQANFYHGNDVLLYDADPAVMFGKIEAFVGEVERRFRMLHFYGRHQMSFFPSEYDRTEAVDVFPRDFFRLRELGIKIGYSVCGCLDGVAQSSVHAWSHAACDRCVWQNDPRYCSDKLNLAWGHKVDMFSDLIATEGFPALDYQKGDKTFREPLTTALDPEFWRPDLEVPEHLKYARAPGELIVYHAVGNYKARAQGGRNLKGTPAVVAAVERLRSEGVNVRLEFVTGVSNMEVRFLQVQADVIVDQLNYGRYGATAREGMMLGRPTVCHINKDEPAGQAKLESIETCPLVSANEATIYPVLRDLLADASRRRAIGEAGRAFALKWHSADACAERFERVYDRLFAEDRVAGDLKVRAS